jgi:hypothetical protein
MIYTVQNKKTKKEYTVSEEVYKTLDMKRKYSLVSSYDEKAKAKILIPEEIIIKSKPKKADNQTDNTND